MQHCRRLFDNYIVWAGIVFMCVMACGSWSAQAKLLSLSPSGGGNKGIVLVSADDEFAGYLKQASKLAKAKDFGRSIRIFQALIERSDSGFVEGSKKPRLFVGLRKRAGDIIAGFPAEGLELYRRLYDPQALELLTKGLERNDAMLLRRILQLYRNTKWAPRAMAALGDIDFESGDMLPAERKWQKASAAKGIEPQFKALMLAKVAAVQYLTGRKAVADKTVGELEKSFADVTAQIGGREQNLVTFAKGVSRMGASLSSGVVSANRRDWPGLGGIADGVAKMADCDVVLTPSWVVDLSSTKLPVAPMNNVRNMQWAGPMGMPMAKAGGFRMFGGLSPSQMVSVNVPASGYPIHPVVVGDLVICRSNQGIVAYRDGRRVWRSYGFPLHASVKPVSNQHAMMNRQFRWGLQRSRGSSIGVNAANALHQGLAVDGGRIYALGQFRYKSVNRYNGRQKVDKNDRNSSVLAAVSIRKQGAMLWSVGDGRGSVEAVRKGQFVSRPTALDGLVYSVVAYREALHAVCLSGATGKVMWSTRVSHMPLPPRGYGQRRQVYVAPIAVSAGKAVVLTNAGVIAAFDAADGTPVWANQYVNASSLRNYGHNRTRRGATPVIISDGKVIFLASDQQSLRVLSLEDGSSLWNMNTQAIGMLAIDSHRVLLYTPKFTIVDVAKRKSVYTGHETIIARPAITARSMYASTTGGLLRFDLHDYSRRLNPLADCRAFLGNLVSADGKLVAATNNALCVYAPYEDTFRSLTLHAGGGDARDDALALFARGRMSFGHHKFKRALNDFTSAASRAAADSVLQKQIGSWQYRTHTAIANRCKNTQGMRSAFVLAAESAVGNCENARATARLALVCELQANNLDSQISKIKSSGSPGNDEQITRLVEAKRNALADALNYAEDLVLRYPDQKLPDIVIAHQAAKRRIDHTDEDFMPAGQWVRRGFIPRLIAVHGRQFHADVDADAGKLLRQALAIADLELITDVFKSLPNSMWAPHAQYEAASLICSRAAVRHAAQDNAELALAGVYLADSLRNSSDPAFRAGVMAGMMDLDLRRGAEAHALCLAGRLASHLRQSGISIDDESRFGGVTRSYRSLLTSAKYDISSDSTHTRTDRAVAGRGQLKHRKVFRFGDSRLKVVTDHALRPAVDGDKVLVLVNSKPVLIDTSAQLADKAVVWRNESMFVGGCNWRRDNVVGCIDTKAGVAVVANDLQAMAFDLKTGKMKWRKSPSEWATGKMSCIGVGGGMIITIDANGRVVCASMETGKVLWRNALVGKANIPWGVPVISRQTVLIPSLSGARPQGRHAQPYMRKRVNMLGIPVHSAAAGSRSVKAGSKATRVTCFDASREGRVIARWDAEICCQARIADEGQIVIAQDNAVSMYDRTRVDRPLWRATEEVGSYAELLGGSQGRIGIAMNGRTRYAVRDIFGGESMGEARITRQRFAPKGKVVAGKMAGDFIYLLREFSQPGVNHAKATDHLAPPEVMKLDTSSGHVVWRAAMGKNKSFQLHKSGRAMDVSGDRVTVAFDAFEGGKKVTRVYIVDANSGDVVQKLAHKSIAEHNPAGRTEVFSVRSALCISGVDGLTVYRPANEGDTGE